MYVPIAVYLYMFMETIQIPDINSQYSYTGLYAQLPTYSVGIRYCRVDIKIVLSLITHSSATLVQRWEGV